MKAGGLACALLLLACGALDALPQYAGVGSQQQQEGQVGQQQKGGFWWKESGIFEGQGANVGPVAPLTSGFTPTQSADCAESFSCVPWQYCVDGFYKFVPDAQVPSDIPDYITNTVCGQSGNICCQIPDEILQQQQQAQAGGISGVDSVLGDALGGVLVGAQGVDGVIASTQGVIGVGGVPSSVGGVHGDSSGISSVGTHSDINQSSVGVSVPDGIAGLLEQDSGITDQCYDGHECVPTLQCKPDGNINQDGAGLINIRTKLRTCVNPKYPGVSAVCCKLPGASQSQLSTCPAHQECVDPILCGNDQVINTDGTGLLDLRITTPCDLDIATNKKGLCCNIPKPTPVTTCPGKLPCRAEDQCTSPVTNTDGSYTECYTNDGSNALGICCEPPAPLQSCGGDRQCRYENACGTPSVINADGSYSKCYVGGAVENLGICCEPPAPLQSCGGERQCKYENACGTPSVINSDGSYSNCYVDGAVENIGICCEPPAPLQSCGGERQCKYESACGTPSIINSDGSYSKCFIDGLVGDTGICCERPAPLQTCPGNLGCAVKGHCASPGAVNADGSYQECYVAGGVDVGICCEPAPSCLTGLVCADQCDLPHVPGGINTACYKADGIGVGVCCEPPIPVVDVCPLGSVCVPELLCAAGLFSAQTDYATGLAGLQCPLNGNANDLGVCCNAETPVVNEQCGSRNYDINTRITSNYNEAAFAEFPWQAIIFFTNYTFKCGGAIINSNQIITGAHCVNTFKPGDLQVRLGEWEVNAYNEEFPYKDYQVSTIQIHPSFNPKNLHNDLAILTLAQPIAFARHINSVCIPDGQQSFSSPCFATGWGKDSFEGNYQTKLKQIDLPLVEHNYCQDLLRKTRLGHHFVLDNSFLCAGGEEGKDACTGDGGGALVCKDDNSGLYFVKGITAWGIGCGTKDVPGVYADVDVLFPQLLDSIGESQQQQQNPGSGYGK